MKSHHVACVPLRRRAVECTEHGAKGLAALAGVSCNCGVELRGFFFELDFDVNNKRRHTQHDAKHTIARTAIFFIAGRPSSAVVVVAEPPPLQTLCMD